MKRAIVIVMVVVSAGLVLARGGGIYLSPTLVTLERDSPTGTVVVRNDTDRVVTFQARSFAWTNAPDTSIHLEPTDDVIVYPATIQLPPGDTRRVRVGSRVQPGRTERGYRLILDEIPEPAEPGRAPIALATRMQFSLPVFLQARDRTARVDMPAPEIVPAGVRVSLVNSGATHVTPQRIELRGLDDAGATVWTRAFKPWYLLAGESRQLEAALSASECAGTRRLVAEAEFAEGRKLTLREDRGVASASCRGQ